ncbi:MAG: GEVED domain-containing protein, partial [Bacteroidota bacterium]
NGDLVVIYDDTETNTALSYVQSPLDNELTLTLRPAADPANARVCLPNLQWSSSQNGDADWFLAEGFPKAYRLEGGTKKKVSVAANYDGSCLQLIFNNYPEGEEVYVELGIHRVTGTEKTSNGCGPSNGTQTTVAGFAPHPDGGTYNWIIEWSVQSQLSSSGYCVQRNNSAPGSGTNYEVTNPSNPNFPHSSSVADNIAAALNAIDDSAVNGDPYFDSQLNQAIWALEGTSSSSNLSGTGLTIYNKVINGDYQPIDVVWFEPVNNSGLQWYIARPEACTDDYGDAPASYGDVSVEIREGVRLGHQVDAEDDNINSSNANGDDNDNEDDEDGVHFVGAVAGCTGYAGSSQTIDIDVRQSALSSVYLNAWIDFNGDGDFDSNERIVSNHQVSNSSSQQHFSFNYTVPTTAAVVLPTPGYCLRIIKPLAQSDIIPVGVK